MKVPASSIGWVSNILADNPDGPAGSVKFAGFTLRSSLFDHPGMRDAGRGGSSAQVFGNGGSTERSRSVRDRWGVTWQFLVKSSGDRLQVSAETGRADDIALVKTQRVAA